MKPPVGAEGDVDRARLDRRGHLDVSPGRRPLDHVNRYLVHAVSVALLFALGCGRFQRTTAARKEIASEKWETHAESAVVKQQQTESVKRETGKRTTRRFRPDGTLDQELVEELVSVTDTRGVETVSVSASTDTKSETKKDVTASSESVSKMWPAGFSLPWWLWAAAIVFMLGLWVRATGWRPWRR